jgi:4-hydroxythreonine-4-phosphate dehydrogenase
MGDRNGIGPEIAVKLLTDAESHAMAELELVGNPKVLASVPGADSVEITAFAPEADAPLTPGEATAAAGREVLASLSMAAKRVTAGEADGLLFAPLNKEAMHLGGLAQEDEMRFLAHELDYQGDFGELNVLDGLWTTRVTSHVPLSQVAGEITIARVGQSIRFAHDTLQSAGYATPRIAVAALNPHAGDGGNFGREEIDVIEPAVSAAQDDGLAVEGPFPSDTVFVRAQRGEFDCVVTMYHDQGQIAMKLMGFGQGVTVLGGLPIPAATCGHGTAYDIVGTGQATPAALKNALKLCVDMAKGQARS